MSTINRTIIEIHALETTAAGNLNRDDTGSPKTVEYGGTTRARVSSQAWKRPTRELFKELVDPNDLGIRTKRVVEELTGRILECRGDLSEEQATTDTDDPIKKIKGDKKRIKQIVSNDRSIDVTLFGRMVADDTDLNVDACAQVAHAISVQTVEPESDFFTAVDDNQRNGGEDEAGDVGAAMMGQVEFNAATFYRYANVDANRLQDRLGDVNATAKAVSAFVQAFLTSVPQGKINTFGQNVLPDLIVVNLRDTQAVNMVGAFERPVAPDYVQHATEALVRRQQDLDRAYDIAPVKTWVVRIGDDTVAADALVDGKTTSLRDMVVDIERTIANRLTQE